MRRTCRRGSPPGRRRAGVPLRVETESTEVEQSLAGDEQRDFHPLRAIDGHGIGRLAVEREPHHDPGVPLAGRPAEGQHDAASRRRVHRQVAGEGHLRLALRPDPARASEQDVLERRVALALRHPPGDASDERDGHADDDRRAEAPGAGAPAAVGVPRSGGREPEHHGEPRADLRDQERMSAEAREEERGEAGEQRAQNRAALPGHGVEESDRGPGHEQQEGDERDRAELAGNLEEVVVGVLGRVDPLEGRGRVAGGGGAVLARADAEDRMIGQHPPRGADELHPDERRAGRVVAAAPRAGNGAEQHAPGRSPRRAPRPGAERSRRRVRHTRRRRPRRRGAGRRPRRGIPPAPSRRG